MIDKVWKRIVAHEGQIFKQIRGKEFAYHITGNTILLSTTNQQVSKGEFEKALEFLPLKNTVVIQHLRAPSYLYAILMDQRICQSEW